MKQINLLLLLVFISVGAFAQVTDHEKMDKRHKTHKMSTEVENEAQSLMYADKVSTRLSLSLEQKEKIQNAQMKRLEAKRDLMESMISDTGNTGEESIESKKEKMKIQDDFKAEMKEILSASQYKDWKEMHDREMKMHHKKAYKKSKEKDSKGTEY